MAFDGKKFVGSLTAKSNRASLHEASTLFGEHLFYKIGGHPYFPACIASMNMQLDPRYP
jgi:hypothetical protein